MTLLSSLAIASADASASVDVFSALMNPLLAALPSFSSQQWFGLIAMIGGLSVGAIIATCAIYFHHKKNQMWHETARVALEKGQPVPPMPLRDEELALRPPAGANFAEWQEAKERESRNHAFRGGLVLIAVGLGLNIMLGARNMIGAIPGFIGVALLLHALIGFIAANLRSKNGNRPPRA